MVEKIAELTKAAKELCADVEFSALDATRTDIDFLIKAAKEAGVNLPVFSSECRKWVDFAKNAYPEIAEGFAPSATSVCAKLLKKYYSAQMPDKKVRVIALEMGCAKKAEPGVDVVLSLEELAQL